MDLSWCPVCDQKTFALENLYCSEACRRKDESNFSHSQTRPSCVSESFYEFPRCASKKPHQSPYNTQTCAPNISPSNSPTLHPQTSSSTTNSIYCDSDYYYYAIRSVPDSEEESKLSSSPSELLQLSRTLSKSKTRTVVPITYLTCKEAISPPPIRKKRSFLANSFFAHYL